MTWTQYGALLALGAFHGLNPAMGWLFAVARGMQERSRTVFLTSLLPIATGHLGSVAIVAAVVSATRSVTTANVVGIAGGVVMVGFGLWRLLSERHFRWAGMRLNAAQLTGWSFLMSSAHGAGLMLLPVLATTPMAGTGHAGHAVPAASGALEGLAAAGVHTVGMLAAMAACGLVVYEFVGLSILRKAWFNIDRLWAGVLVGAGVITIALTR
ncbi:hypothetical protein AB0M02_19240 [Actinoplanes sp. NPDC051861]|uniref:hypothetical protein n=1 Tax=Actinoplanes sp. NPDC051861 TaxID=3155170 RepID=UPI0034392DB2